MKQIEIISNKVKIIDGLVTKLVYGCQAREEINDDLNIIDHRLQGLYDVVHKLEEQKEYLKSKDKELEDLGYCKKDKVFYYKENGIVVERNSQPMIKGYTHSDECNHKDLVVYNLDKNETYKGSHCNDCPFYNAETGECRGFNVCCFDADAKTLTLIDPVSKLPMSSALVEKYKEKLEKEKNLWKN